MVLRSIAQTRLNPFIFQQAPTLWLVMVVQELVLSILQLQIARFFLYFYLMGHCCNIFQMSARRSGAPFLLKTYDMLMDSQNSSVVRWNDQGTGFSIIDQQGFMTLLPKHFKHKNIPSYVRQLNMYGFAKRRGSQANHYYHALFRKDRPELIAQIQRKVQKKQPKKARSSTVSIQDKLPADQQLLKMNLLLHMEQIANLRMLEQEVMDVGLKEQLAQSIQTYNKAHDDLFRKVGVIEKVGSPTTATFTATFNHEQE